MADIERRVTVEFGVSVDSLQHTVHGRQNQARLAAIALGQRHGEATLGELANRYGFKNYSGAASAIGRFNDLVNSDDDVAAKVDRIVRPQNPDRLVGLTLERQPRTIRVGQNR